MVKKSLFLQILLFTALQSNIIFCNETTNQLSLKIFSQIENLQQKLEQKETAREWNIAYAAIYGTLTTIRIVNIKEVGATSIFAALTALNIYFSVKRNEEKHNITKEIDELKAFLYAQKAQNPS